MNLIGEHTDYNLGLVMPAAISLETTIATWPADDGMVRLTSLHEGQGRAFEVDAPGARSGDWTDYLAGVAVELGRAGVTVRGVVGVIDSAIPIGAGLSSSAALEVAAAWTLCADVPPPLPTLEVARLAQRAENDYVGVRSGLMDQFAACFGQAGSALLLDCRSLDHRAVPIPDGLWIVAVDSRAPRQLAASAYNARREECERGVAAIARRHPKVRSLRDVTPEMLESCAHELDEIVLRRCRHVVMENARVARVADALASADLDELSRLFAASHASLRDLYEVSSAELDALVDIAATVPGVVGARMTGAGFGGCTVNLVRSDAVDELRLAVERDYPLRTGRHASFYVVDAAAGAGLMT